LDDDEHHLILGLEIERNLRRVSWNDRQVGRDRRIIRISSFDIRSTPLIRLPKLSKETGCEILVKAEYLNPGGSIKDRAALFLIDDGFNRSDLH
jgi:hypothetical protein